MARARAVFPRTRGRCPAARRRARPNQPPPPSQSRADETPEGRYTRFPRSHLWADPCTRPHRSKPARRRFPEARSNGTTSAPRQEWFPAHADKTARHLRRSRAAATTLARARRRDGEARSEKKAPRATDEGGQEAREAAV